MRRRVDRPLGSHSRSFVGCHLDPNLVGDRVRDLTLEGKDVSKAALVTPRPQATVACHINQLHCDAHSVADPQRRALDYSIHTQVPREFGQWRMDPLEPHCRSARDDSQRRDLREVGDQRVGHPVSEELLGWVP